MLELARTKSTAHPLLMALLATKHINQAAGGAVIAPWEIDSLPEEWLDAAETLIADLPGMRKGVQQIEEIKTKWRREHMKKHG